MKFNSSAILFAFFHAKCQKCHAENKISHLIFWEDKIIVNNNWVIIFWNICIIASFFFFFGESKSLHYLFYTISLNRILKLSEN